MSAAPTPEDRDEQIAKTLATAEHAAEGTGEEEYPTRLDEYRLLHRIGSGAMGAVFEAHDMFLDRRVAIKFIRTGNLNASAHERFLREARAVARLHHPNIIVVYRIGNQDGRWYLVSELVRGQSLDLLQKPLPVDQALRIARDLARGLGAAHRRGVLHRDIKPGNAILSETGEAKLLDFGLAKLVRTAQGGDEVELSSTLEQSLSQGATGVGAILGTPLYMPLEILRGQPATPRSDIYSLGALLYELSAGAPPYQARNLMQLAVLIAEGEPRPIGELAPDLPPPYAALLDRCLRRDPAARPASCEDLCAILDELLSPGARPALQPEGNPYRGLRPFEAEHRGLFFGRSQEVRALLDRLRSDPLLLLCGDSGVGKSSLCRAGLLPAVTEGALGDGRRWVARTLSPGPRPLQGLADLLSVLCDLSESEVAARIVDEPSAVIYALARKQGDDRGVVLFIDQLEELVTQGDRSEATRVAEFLGLLAVLVPGVRLVMTGRIDFLARLAALPGLGRELERALYIVRPLTEEGLHEAVTGPASRHGFSFDSEEMVGELVRAAAAADGGLPLLQFALSELWWARDPERRLIPARALAQIGGVTGALARHADAVITGLSEAQKRCARRLLFRLITEEGTRAARPEDELIGADPDARAALEALIKGRLLVAREAGVDEAAPAGRRAAAAVIYEIAHEALLSGWQTLRHWLAQDAEERAARGRLDRAAAEWVRLERRDDLLLAEAQLRELSPALLESLSAREDEFVRASQLVARRRRLLRRALLAALPVLLILVYQGARLRDQRLLARRVDAHVSSARTALAGGREGAAALATLQGQAFARFDSRRPEEGERLFQRAVELFSDVDGRLRLASREAEAAMVLDRGGGGAKDLFAQILYEQVRLLGQPSSPPYGRAQKDDLLQRLRTYDDGRMQARLSQPARLELLTDPPGAAVTARPYEEHKDGFQLGARSALGSTPLDGATLPPGAYLLELSAAGRPAVRLPVSLESGEALRVQVPLPALVPEGYVFVPPGRFLYGAGGEDALRHLYATVQPRHEVRTGGYLIGRTEVTFGDWLAYLRALPREERAARLLRVEREHQDIKQGLSELPDGGFALTLALVGARFTLKEGEPLRYPGRVQQAVHDWRRLPVTGMSLEEAQGYAVWLDRSRRLPGARLCSEHEWERAARGADGRLFPHGNVLRPGDANHDATYGREPRSFGPDEVGAHPASDSPFGVADLAGNVWEWTRSVVSEDEVVYRGGGWYQGLESARSINRELGERGMRDSLVGLRICADFP